jgi:hypothetical protein
MLISDENTVSNFEATTRQWLVRLKTICYRIGIVVLVCVLYFGAVFFNVWLYDNYKYEKQTTGEEKGFYWIETIFKTCILTATQVIIPFSLVYSDMKKWFILLSWILCVGISVLFRVGEVTLRSYWFRRFKSASYYRSSFLCVRFGLFGEKKETVVSMKVSEILPGKKFLFSN